MSDLSILLAEDDENLGRLLRDFLMAKGYSVHLSENGKEALTEFANGSYDFVILDVMMPEMDGFTAAKEIRQINSDIPILFLTARSMKEDTLEGFKAGADDYMTKPFSMEELLARMNAILKRVQPKQANRTEFEIGNSVFDSNRQTLITGEKEVKLTTRESGLFKLLVEKKNEVLDRNTALKALWGDDSYYNSRSMDVYITKLRKYLKEDSNLEIMTVHGKGFKLLEN